MKFMEDERFNEYGKLAPKSKADFAFVQHMVHHMDEDGRAVVLLPHGVLFRGAAEETIRKYLIEKLNVLDAVIGLPANLFFGTGIPVCVLPRSRASPYPWPKPPLQRGGSPYWRCRQSR